MDLNWLILRSQVSNGLFNGVLSQHRAVQLHWWQLQIRCDVCFLPNSSPFNLLWKLQDYLSSLWFLLRLFSFLWWVLWRKKKRRSLSHSQMSWKQPPWWSHQSHPPRFGASWRLRRLGHQPILLFLNSLKLKDTQREQGTFTKRQTPWRSKWEAIEGTGCELVGSMGSFQYLFRRFSCFCPRNQHFLAFHSDRWLFRGSFWLELEGKLSVSCIENRPAFQWGLGLFWLRERWGEKRLGLLGWCWESQK